VTQGFEGACKEDFTEGIIKKVRSVKLLVLDVDGVLTDGRITYTDDGRELKSFNVRDGHGIKLLMRAGVECAVITARDSVIVERRCKELGIERLYQGATTKLGVYEELIAACGLDPTETAYVGDDLIDLPVLRRVGFSCAPMDAVAEVKGVVDCVTKALGGGGAVREVVEIILKIQDKWEGVTERYRV
jgi:3-deoxy-D-manno-octulosonate 8-phosphate phosphatase (KDO 8-P phosphatase)